jgi:hypothetical protein
MSSKKILCKHFIMPVFMCQASFLFPYSYFRRHGQRGARFYDPHGHIEEYVREWLGNDAGGIH